MKFLRFIPVLALIFGPVFAHAEMVDGIRAVVGDRVITVAEVEEYTRPAADTLRRQYAGRPEVFNQKLNDALIDSLHQLVERALILHSFENDGYHLPDSVIDQVVQDRIREKYGDRVTLIKTLQAQGMTFEQFRKQIREQYIENAMRNQNVSREIIISPFKVESYYQSHQDDFKLDDQVKLRMIVLNKTSPDDTNTVALANEVITKLKEGANFSDMAAVYSQGSQQHQAGDWGWVERSVLRKELADVAFSLQPGQTSSAIDTPDAVYVMLVEDKKASHDKPLAEVRSDIEKTLRIQQQEMLSRQWIDGLSKKTFVLYLDLGPQ
jgi:peptidyl-prolyl cis-trans isomerase SurA